MQDDQGNSAVTKITLSVDFPSEKEAKDAASALKVDDDEFISTVLEGSTVRGEAKANTVEGARRAADDWLACLMAVIRKK